MKAAFPREAVAQRLAAGLEALDAVRAWPLAGLVDYLALLHRWNRAFNLSAVRDPLAMVPRHLLDSLSALAYVDGPRVVDIGSGAGLPGIPLALCRPELRVALLDSNGKKTRFLRQAVAELSLGNAEVIHARAETWEAAAPFDTAVTRAYSTLDRTVTTAAPLLADQGCVVAMKARFDAAGEAADLPAGWQYAVHPVIVPGLDAQRCVVTVRRCGPGQEGESHG